MNAPSSSTPGSSNNNNNNNSNKKKLGEPHRIYWQQWIAGCHNSTGTGTGTHPSASAVENPTAPRAIPPLPGAPPEEERLSRRELITSSAAVRLSRSAKAKDLTALLRQTLQLPELLSIVDPSTTGSTGTIESQDCLVLVGSLYSLPKGFIQYEHERILHFHRHQMELEQQQQQQQQQQQFEHPPFVPQPNGMDSAYYAFANDPCHIVRTLQPTESPLEAYDAMTTYLQRFLLEECSNDPSTAIPLSMSAAAIPPPIPNQRSVPRVNSSSSSTGSSRSIAPKLQWYYVPAAAGTTTPDSPFGNANNTNNNYNNNTLIPNCVELDGYCTAMEGGEHEGNDSDMYDDFDDDCRVATTESISDKNNSIGDSSEDRNRHLLRQKFPWLQAPPKLIVADDNNNNVTTEAPPSSTDRYIRKLQKRSQQEDCRFAQLSLAEAMTPQRIAGYLLHRDPLDRNVWRRVHCVLTDDDLWFTSRIYTTRSTPSLSLSIRTKVEEASTSDNNNLSNEPAAAHHRYRYAKHSRIRLSRALLLEPSVHHMALLRTPYAFEVVSSKGTSHIFRANSKQQQLMWISSLSDRIIQSHESSLLKHAELLISDECNARSRRSTKSAVEPLWDEAIRIANEQQSQENGVSSIKSPKSVTPALGNSIGSVLRWGLDVALYRDRCRYTASSMPVKSPLVVMTAPPRRRFFASNSNRNSMSLSSPSSDILQQQPQVESLDSLTTAMIQATWEQADALLTRALSLALTLQVRSSIKHSDSEEPVKLSHGIDTLCRHIDFVITGKLLQNKDRNTTPDSSDSHNVVVSNSGRNQRAHDHHKHDGPPPEDLFDHLLVELQCLAANADRRVHHHGYDGHVAHPSTALPPQQT